MFNDLITPAIPIASIVTLFFYIISSSKIEYIDAIVKTWNFHPIFNISLTPKEGYEKYTLFNTEDIDTFCDCTFIDSYGKSISGECNSILLNDGCIQYNKVKATKFNNQEFYVSYYDADYFTLFSRIDSKDSNLCKDEYKKCGFLDIFNNAFCVKQTEECPINDIFINKTEIITNNTRRDLPVINRLFISENKVATIFDINKIFTFKVIEEINKEIYHFDQTYRYFHLDLIKKEILKSDFYSQNNLFIGDTPNYFNTTPLYLYHLKYPGTNIDYPMNTFYIFLIRYRLVILFSFIALKLLLGARFWRGYSILYDQTLIYHILNIILYSIYLIFNVINILFYVAKYRLDRNIYYYEKNVYDARNYESACGATFFGK